MIEIVSTEPQTVERKVSSEEVCKKYRKISRNRPPFCYEAPSPEYPAADESRLYALEQKIFDVTKYPSPPDDPIFRGAYEALIARHQAMEDTIGQIKSLDGLHVEMDPTTEVISETREGAGLPPNLHQDPAQKKELFEIEKKHWESHYKSKKLFFHQALSYLYLMECHHPEEAEQKNSKRFRQEAYAMFIGHQGTTYSRSASHELGPVRRDKQPTIKHPYTVAVHGINFWLQKIEGTNSEEERDQFFEELNLEIIRDLFHDTQEDYFISEEDLICKLIEMLNFDFRIGTRFRRAGEKLRIKDGKPGTPKNINFAYKNGAIILKELWALTEEEEDKDLRSDQPYYLERKLVEVPTERRPQVFLSKVRDRTNNLKNPRYKDPGKTLVKLNETLKIIKIGVPLFEALRDKTLVSAVSDTDIHKEILGLIQVGLQELGKYKSTPEFSGLTEQDLAWSDFWESTNKQFEFYQAQLAT